MGETSAFLDVQNIDVFYGGIQALHGVSLHVNKGEIVSVIGANGAGKSTLLKTIASVKNPSKGSIVFEERKVPTDAHKVVLTGITLVPEGRRIFAPLTVRENLMVGAYTRTDKDEMERTLEEIFSLFPRLKERLFQRGGTLSGGEQQMLAVARALMSQPKVLMLDEPSLGLAPIVYDAMFDVLVRLNQEKGMTILLVEQNAILALGMSHRAYVLETGRISLEGKGEDLLEDPRVQASYLGISH
jgi:branched-chain amino acid transport system ATP-binding protein